MALCALPNRLYVGRVPSVEYAIQIGTRTPWLLCGPGSTHIKVAGGSQRINIFRIVHHGIDAELLPLLHGSRSIARIMVGECSATQEGDLPGLAIGQEPHLVRVAL